MPILSKIFEKVILTRLNLFLKSINFISPAQYGFCPASSTEAACANLLNDIQKGLDKKKNIRIGLIYIDLTKAFETVLLNALKRKLSNAGIKNKEFDLLQSYLSNRYQYIQNENFCSSRKLIICGVPQGAILSPTLFNVFINDIVNLSIYGKLIIYADDICLKYEDINPNIIIKHMESDLKKLNDWFITNKLSLNIKKTKCMFICPKHLKNDQITPPKLNNIHIELVNEYKYLGLYIDSDLKWIAHINHVKSKILPIIGILKRLKYVLPVVIKKQIYHAFIQSHLNYINIIWGSTSQTHINCIKVLQNFAIKHIYKLNYLEPTVNVYKKSKLPNFDTLRKINLVIFLYKLKNNLIKSDLSLTLNSEIHSYSTRISNSFRVDYARTNFGKFAVLREAIHLYNTIPNDLKNLPQLHTFKTCTKMYFLSIQNG